MSNNCVYLDNSGGSDDTQNESHNTTNGTTSGVDDPEGELCVAGASLALGYVGVGHANSFVKRTFPGEQGEVGADILTLNHGVVEFAVSFRGNRICKFLNILWLNKVDCFSKAKRRELHGWRGAFRHSTLSCVFFYNK